MFALLQVRLWLLNGVVDGKLEVLYTFKLAGVGMACGVRLEAHLKMKGSE